MSRKSLQKTKYENLYYEVRNGVNHHYLRFKVKGKEFKRKICVGMTHKEANIAASETRLRMERIYEDSLKSSTVVSSLMKSTITALKPSMAKDFEYKMRHTFTHHFKEYLNRDITTITIRELQLSFNEKLINYKPATVEYTFYNCWNNLYKHARSVYDVKPNIMKEIKLPNFDNTVHFSITLDNAQKLYKAIVEYPDAKYRSVFLFALQGRRKGEIAHLKWHDVDMRNGYYIVKAENNKLRTNDMYRLTELQMKTLKEIPVVSEYVHANGAGNPLYHFHKRWYKLLKDAGIPHMRFHDFRHLLGCFASDEGFSLQQTGKALGHRNPATTERYSRVSTEMAFRVSSAVEERLRG